MLYFSILSPQLHNIIAGFNIREESIDEDEQKEAETNKTKRFIPSQTIDVVSPRWFV